MPLIFPILAGGLASVMVVAGCNAILDNPLPRLSGEASPAQEGGAGGTRAVTAGHGGRDGSSESGDAVGGAVSLVDAAMGGTREQDGAAGSPGRDGATADMGGAESDYRIDGPGSTNGADGGDASDASSDACSNGFKNCSGTSSCVPTSGCCVDGDCTSGPANTTGVCSSAHACSYPCASGFRTCTASAACVACCSDNDCPAATPICHAVKHSCQARATLAFALRTDYTTGAGPNAVAMADLSGMGHNDVVVANSGNANVAILVNDGSGIFNLIVPYPTGATPVSIALARFNDDDRNDLAVLNASGGDAGTGNVGILLNRGGSGNFFPPVNYGAGTGPWGLAAGDLNGDTRIDLAVTNIKTGTVTTLFNMGSGVFAVDATYPVRSSSPNAVAIGDLNADGLNDLVTSDDATQVVSVLLNMGNGAFPAAASYNSSPVGNPQGSRAIALGDLNADGFNDVVIGSRTASNVSILLNNGNGTLAAPVNYPAGSSTNAVAVGDLNGDGRNDLAVANDMAGTVSVLLANAVGGFDPPVALEVGASPRGVAIGDLNGDGKNDLAVANGISANVSILLNRTQ